MDCTPTFVYLYIFFRNYQCTSLQGIVQLVLQQAVDCTSVFVYQPFMAASWWYRVSTSTSKGLCSIFYICTLCKNRQCSHLWQCPGDARCLLQQTMDHTHNPYVSVHFAGIGNAAVYGNVLVILGVYFNKRRSLANGVALAGASIGQFVLPPFIEFLLETYGLQGCLLLVSTTLWAHNCDKA